MSVRKPRKSRIPIVRRPQDKWRLTEEQEDRFRELEHLYMIKWNAIRPLTSINHRLDYFLDPEDEMYDFAVSTHETAYRKLLVELDLYLLDMVKLYAPFPLYRDLMEQHSDLVLDTSERCPGPRMNYKELYGSENVKRCTINEMRDRWRKKTINIDVLMENAPLFHAVVSSWEYTYQRVLTYRYKDIGDCLKSCDGKIMNLMTESTDTNYLRYGFLRRHIELRERFKQFQKWYKENYSITAREAVCDYFRDPEIETKEGLMRQYMFEFLEAAGPMFKLYDAAKVYNCQPRVFRTPLYHTYVKWVRKLDATLKIAMRRDYYFTENMTWMAELRAAIPNPPPGAWLTRWKYMLLGPARNDVEAFFKKVEKWMR